jgi:uncharacterized protein YdaU (DUF1376 family)
VSKADVWMPLYIADYLRDTMHLTRDQHGGYLLLLMACWDRGGKLPNDPGQLAGIAKASPAEWKKIGPILMSFFDTEGEFITQRRVVSEYEKASRISESRRQSGLQGGRPRKQTESDGESKTESNEKPNGFANGKQTGSQTETPTLVARQSPSPRSSDPDGSALAAPLASLDDDLDPLAELRALPVAKGCWRLAVKVLVEQGHLSDQKARAFVGKLKSAGLSDDDLWQIAEAAFTQQTEDPQAYLVKAAQGVQERRGEDDALLRPSEFRQRAWMTDFTESPRDWRDHERGPRPGQIGCRVTPEIQREFGVEPAKLQAVGSAA